MTSFAGLSPAGILTVRAGEPLVLRITLTNAAGATQSLLDRTLALVVRRSAQLAPMLAIAAELAGDAMSAVAMMSAAQATAVYEVGAARALSYDIVETTGGASVSRWSARIEVGPAPDLPSDIVPVIVDLPTTEALIAPDTIVITERGAAGASAAQQLYDANMIEAPTVAAMDARYAQASEVMLAAYGFRAGAVAAYAMRQALIDARKLQAVADALPADPTDPATMRWLTAAPVVPGDALATFIATTLSLDAAATNALFVAARSHI